MIDRKAGTQVRSWIALLALAFTSACVTEPTASTPGVQALAGKVIVKRGGKLQEDIERLLTGGYTPIGSHAYSAENFAAAADIGRETGRRAGAHLVTLYEALAAADVGALRFPVTLSERGLGVTPAEVLKRVQPAAMVAVFWARPARSSAFGAYFYEDATPESPHGMPEQKGLRVAFIVRRSPALLGGLQPGDLLLEIDGKPVAPTAAAFIDQVAATRGNLPEFRFYRDGEIQEAEVDVSP